MADITSDAIVQSLSIGRTATALVIVTGVASQSLSIGLLAGSTSSVKLRGVQSLAMGQAAVGSVPVKAVAVQSLAIGVSARVGPLAGVTSPRVVHPRLVSRTVKARAGARLS